ncbi:UNVERIFIED_CONTAM: hypothetical protein RMT77_015225 [Armadillidium vulgare]
MERTSSYQWVNYIGGIPPWLSDDSEFMEILYQFPDDYVSGLKIPAILLAFLFVLCIGFEYFDVEILQFVLSVIYNFLLLAWVYGLVILIFRKF